MQIARKRTQFPKEARDQTMQEFIDQKKEMFHAQLAFQNVEREIQVLDQKKNERHAALEKSKQELDDDHGALMNFIQQDKKQLREEERLLKAQEQQKHNKEDQLKKLDADIAAICSEIEKHKDALDELKANKEFLLELTPADERELLLEAERRKRQVAFE